MDPTPAPKGLNGYGGHPSMRGLGAHYELEVTCGGVPDAITGYLVNIKVIDEATRLSAIPIIARAFRDRPEIEPSALIEEIARSLANALEPELIRLVWKLTPTYAVELAMGESHAVIMRQRFDFAASHRLHCETLSDQENRALFGKCNSPSGHGHNYQVEPAVALPVDSSKSASPFTLQILEQLTEDLIVDHFDHKHLNLDTEEFGPNGENPSVEHIARICFERLAPAIGERGAELRRITVWETDRTSCTYPG